MITRIDVHALAIGMYIERFDGAWMDHPFWRNGFVLKSADELARVRASRVTGVWIDTARGVAPVQPVPVAAPAPPAVAAAASPVPAPAAQRRAPTSMQDELQHAAGICQVARQAITAVFDEARMGRVHDCMAARGLVEDISDSVMRNPGAMVSLARLKTADGYTYMHSVAVCALMVALARQLGLDEEQTRAAGLAGLLHDIGKARLPLQVLNKPGALTEAEFAIVRGHPECGYAMLAAVGDVDADAMDGCLHHHEKMDGTGYPHGLAGAQISLVARMSAVCDVYDAVTSERPYKKAWDPAEALRRMAGWTDAHLDKHLFQALVKSIGIYPVGSLVRLSSGRLAVVMDQSDALVAPRVKVFYSTRSQARVPPEVLDLGRLDDEKIVAREDPRKWRFADLNELWGGFAAQPW
ncbi:HD-GYP domain-containing protein [Pseudorhodoferax sp. Leaf267]|uniref:HD-GYP domain-containing protein n=1 Tax=Pseudorhodoferax sp. Leaf267 TaxID=1736316 RepID=UPI0006FDA222|nr:HD-GYP domain-containing protein [Pseudorhodoferax sp. Leaf267]KQP13158.1 phosphodiesterase [Pseudorhodoferax sp. Leaf267]